MEGMNTSTDDVAYKLLEFQRKETMEEFKNIEKSVRDFALFTF